MQTRRGSKQRSSQMTPGGEPGATVDVDAAVDPCEVTVSDQPTQLSLGKAQGQQCGGRHDFVPAKQPGQGEIPLSPGRQATVGVGFLPGVVLWSAHIAETTTNRRPRGELVQSCDGYLRCSARWAATSGEGTITTGRSA
jgi:hypothetical protein